MSRGTACCALLAAIALAAAPSASWDELNREGTHLQGEGRYSEAKAVFLRALQSLGDAGQYDARTPITLNNLASICQDLEDVSTAKRYYEQAIAAFERTHGKDNPVLAKPLHNLATLLLEQGQFATAERLRRRALALHSSTEGLSDADTIMLSHGLAAALLGQGRATEAESIYRALLFGGVSGREAAEIHNDLAVLCTRRARYQEAAAELQESIHILELTAGTGHPALLRPLSNLAVVHAAMARYDDAGTAMRRALAIATGALGEGEAYGRLLQSYAVILRKLRRSGEAKAAAKHASEILSVVRRDPSFGYTVDIGELVGRSDQLDSRNANRDKHH